MIPGSVTMQPKVADERQPLHPPASKRQMEVACLLADGCSIQEIARALGVKVVTVKYHMRQVAARINSDLPGRIRVVLWYRGAAGSLLNPPNGAALRRAMRAAKHPIQR